jgi:hypothetical protein
MVTDDQRRVLQEACDAYRRRNDWPNFGMIDRPLRRPGVDPAALIRTMPSALLVQSRPGPPVNPDRDDPVRLTILGMSLCTGVEDDVERFLFMTRWSAELEARFDPGDNAAAYEHAEPEVRRQLVQAAFDKLWIIGDECRSHSPSEGARAT